MKEEKKEAWITYYDYKVKKSVQPSFDAEKVIAAYPDENNKPHLKKLKKLTGIDLTPEMGLELYNRAMVALYPKKDLTWRIVDLASYRWTRANVLKDEWVNGISSDTVTYDIYDKKMMFLYDDPNRKTFKVDDILDIAFDENGNLSLENINELTLKINPSSKERFEFYSKYLLEFYNKAMNTKYPLSELTQKNIKMPNRPFMDQYFIKKTDE